MATSWWRVWLQSCVCATHELVELLSVAAWQDTRHDKMHPRGLVRKYATLCNYSSIVCNFALRDCVFWDNKTRKQCSLKHVFEDCCLIGRQSDDCCLIDRLKNILRRLKHDDVSREDLIKNMQYVSRVISAAYKRESRCVFNAIFTYQTLINN